MEWAPASARSAHCDLLLCNEDMHRSRQRLFPKIENLQFIFIRVFVAHKCLEYVSVFIMVDLHVLSFNPGLIHHLNPEIISHNLFAESTMFQRQEGLSHLQSLITKICSHPIANIVVDTIV
jgi:hypothetical protein